MPQYRFQLESLQRLREADRDRHRERLAIVLQAQSQLAEQAEAVEREISDISSSQRALLTRDLLDVNALVEHQRYEFALKAQRKVLRQQADTLDEEGERRRSTLAEAEKQVRVLEKLDERRRREFRQAEEREEDRRLSEVATQRFLRQKAERTKSERRMAG